jgi:hypothetical protein
MTTHRPTNQERHTCSWCNYPGATHEGGLSPNGPSGWFCSQEHFDLWVKWQGMLSPLKEQTRIGQFTEAKV